MHGARGQARCISLFSTNGARILRSRTAARKVLRSALTRSERVGVVSRMFFKAGEMMNLKQLQELLLQSLEHERGGVKIYRMALQCVLNKDLRKEWTHYLEQTERHVQILTETCAKLGIDPGIRTPGCHVVRENGIALVRAMEMALAAGDPKAAEIVACEAVVLAETKDHADWELIGAAAKAADGATAEALKAAYDQVEDEEDEHLYHTKGWCRELWLASLGLKAQLPPPEETQNVKSEKSAALVKEARMGKQ
jgi:hypothetical protein